MEKLYDGTFVSMVRRDGWEFATREGISGIVLIIPLTDDGALILNEQYRVPVQARCIELPAGLVGDEPGQEEESLADGARRELLEETGYYAEHLQQVAEGPPSAGITNEVLTVFKATGLRKVHLGGGTDSEGIIVHKVPLAEAQAWLLERQDEGCLIDPKVYMGLFFAGIPCE